VCALHRPPPSVGAVFLAIDATCVATIKSPLAFRWELQLVYDAGLVPYPLRELLTPRSAGELAGGKDVGNKPEHPLQCLTVKYSRIPRG